MIAPFVGGAFGSGLRPHYHLPLALMAALELRRPVRLTLTRRQMFTFAHRSQSIQHVASIGNRASAPFSVTEAEIIGRPKQPCLMRL
ncbi:molybdopterin-dependent oxidoreductase [Paraburkholderia fungorum]